MKSFRLTVITLSIVCLFSYKTSAETLGLKLSQPTAPFALTISGGISLGSYEAGTNWALVEFMKNKIQPTPSTNYLNPDLVALTGASAGSINATMSAITWCLDPARISAGTAENSIDDNLLRSVWLKVGLDELLPPEKAEYSNGQGMPPDALFSRKKAFSESIEKFKEILRQPVFKKEECRIPIGMLTTREVPPEIAVNKVRVKNQRFVFAVEFYSKDGWGHFRTVIVDEDDPDFGTVVYLPGKKENNEFRVETDDVVKLLYASSAFPLAFSKIHLSYCTSREGLGGSAYCPPGTNLMNANFVDGGVFDNVPLGAARALAEPSPIGRKSGVSDPSRNGRRHWYIFISPNNRRGYLEFPSDRQQKGSDTFGLKGMVSFLPGVLNTLGDYELYTLLRSGKWSRQSHDLSEKVLGLLSKNTVDSSPMTDADKSYSYSEDIKSSFANFEQNRKSSSTTQECTDNSMSYIQATDEKLEYNNLPFNIIGPDQREYSVFDTRQKLLSCLYQQATVKKRDDLAHDISLSILDIFSDRKVLLTSRHFAITGAYLDHFGAFLDPSFREFDYYSGIYDTVNDMAEFTCQGENETRRETCLGMQAKEIYSSLGIEGSEKGRSIFVLLAQHEHSNYDQDTSPWHWIKDELGKNVDVQMENIFLSLKATIESSKDDATGEKNFEKFVKALKQRGFKTVDGSVMRDILDRSDQTVTSWYAPTVGRLGERLQILQAEENRLDPDASGWHFLTKAIALGSGKYFGYDRFFSLGPSSEPSFFSKAWKLIPYEFDADLTNGGFSAAYIPQWRSGHWSLDLKLTPIGYANFAPGRVGFSEIDMYGSYHSREKFLSVGVGPTANFLWNGVQGFNKVNLGFAGYFEFFRTFRFTLGVRTIDEGPGIRNNFFLLFGLTDLPGTLSRIFR